MADDFDFDTNFADFIDEMANAEQPNACSIDNPDCEACGS